MLGCPETFIQRGLSITAPSPHWSERLVDTRPLVFGPPRRLRGCRRQTILSQWWLPALDPPHRENVICALLAVSMRPWAPADSCCPTQLLAVLPAVARGGGGEGGFPFHSSTASLHSEEQSRSSLYLLCTGSLCLTTHWAGPLSRVLPAALHRPAFLSQPSGLL